MLKHVKWTSIEGDRAAAIAPWKSLQKYTKKVQSLKPGPGKKALKTAAFDES